MRTDGPLNASSLRTLYADTDHAVASSSDFVISIENTAPTVAHLGRVMGTVRTFARQQGGTTGLLIVIRNDARPPSDEMRAHIVRMFTDMEGILGALAYVMEGEGFIAAAKRSVLALMMATKRCGFPIKVFRTAGDGVPWLAVTLRGREISRPTLRRQSENLAVLVAGRRPQRDRAPRA